MAVLLDELTNKVEAGERLSDGEIAALGSTRDIIKLGMLATIVRRKLHGTDVTYLRVLELTPKGPDPGTLAGEVRMLETPATLDACVEAVEHALEAAGETPLSAFSLFELSELPESLPVVLAALKKSGLRQIAQAPLDRLVNPEQSLQALMDEGLTLSRLTIDETPNRDWTDVCREVALLQTKLGCIRAFAPLARKIDPAVPTTGYADVKRVATARLLAENVDSIQVDWALYGPKLAQVALTFGADDIDSVPAADDQSQGRRRSPTEEIRRSIRAAGFQPVERDGRFQRLD